jgi:hypothetical protein
VTRKDLTKKCTSAAKELAALWKQSSTRRTERGNLTAETLDEEWCPKKLADSILGCGEHLHGKALKLYKNKEACQANKKTKKTNTKKKAKKKKRP